jgi:amidase
MFQDAGASVVYVEFPTLRDFGDAEFDVLLYEFKDDLNKYLAARGGAHKTLKDLINFNDLNAEKEMPYFGQEIFVQAQAKAGLEDAAYRLALQKSKMLTQEQGIDAAVKKYNVDAFVAPSGGIAWNIDLVNGDCGVFESSSLAAVAGYPNITVPAGYVQGLPVGISFFGPAFSEPTLIKFAYAFEQATKARRVPKYLPTYPG